MEVTRYIIFRAGSTPWWCNLVHAFPEYDKHFYKVYLEKSYDANQIALAAIRMKLGEDVVNRVHWHMKATLASDCWFLAARLNDVRIMIYMEGYVYHRCDTDLFVVEAALNGSLNCLKHALSCGWKFSVEALHAAIEAGHFLCIQFLHEECGVAYTDRTMMIAVKSGYLPLIQLLYETKCPWGADVCEAMAMNDQLDCLKFAHEKGCPWDIRTCLAAARSGSLRCLEYAHLQGCDWNVSVGQAVNDECLQYVRQHRSTVPFAPASSVLFAKVLTYSIVFTLVHEMYRTVVVCQLCALLMHLIDKYRYSQYAYRLGVPEFEQKKIRVALYNAALVSLCLTVVPVMCDLWYGGLSVKCRMWWKM